jgi:RNA polymerase sigma-70 factor (ECF subfamily)
LTKACDILQLVHLRAAETDAELAEAIAGGDPAAETALYERYVARVRYIALRRLQSKELAEDACNETFVRAIAAIRNNRLRAAESVASFLLQTTRYVVLEMLRQQRPGHTAINEDDPRLVTLPEEPVDDATVSAVRATLGELGERDRRFLRMYYFDELPGAEIARRLGISEDRVRLIKSRALQRFKRAYREP